jgi:hypothetical protein
MEVVRGYGSCWAAIAAIISVLMNRFVWGLIWEVTPRKVTETCMYFTPILQGKKCELVKIAIE